MVVKIKRHIRKKDVIIHSEDGESLPRSEYGIICWDRTDRCWWWLSLHTSLKERDERFEWYLKNNQWHRSIDDVPETSLIRDDAGLEDPPNMYDHYIGELS